MASVGCPCFLGACSWHELWLHAFSCTPLLPSCFSLVSIGSAHTKPHGILSFGIACNSTFFYMRATQIIETHFSLFPLSFGHPFLVKFTFDSHKKELEFLSVPSRVWCPEMRTGMTRMQDNKSAFFVPNMLPLYPLRDCIYVFHGSWCVLLSYIKFMADHLFICISCHQNAL